VRGEIIDIHPADSEREAIRVELFDEEIENLSIFDPLTGEIIKKVARFTVYPKTHYATPREVILGAIEHIKVELRERLGAGLLQWHRKLFSLFIESCPRRTTAVFI